MRVRSSGVRLARQRRNLTQEALAERARLSPRTVRRAERGEVLGAYARQRLCEALGRSAEELGLVPASPVGDAVLPSVDTRHGDGDMNRRGLLGILNAAAGVTGGALIWSPDLGIETVRASDAAEPARLVSDITRGYRLMEATTPSPELITPVRGHLSLARRALTRWEDDGLSGADLQATYAALSEIASFTAWLHLDLGDTPAAWLHYDLAIQLAERSGHDLLLPYQIIWLAHLAAECGESQQALALVERARACLPTDAPAAATALFASIEAMGWARAPDRDGALKALDAAEAAVPPGLYGPPRWPWLNPFDHTGVSYYRALSAARLGDTKTAEEAFEASQPGLRSPKWQARVLVELAQALASRREAGEACRLATKALSLARPMDSRLIIQKVAQVRHSLGVDRCAETAELDERLTALVEREHPAVA